MSARGPTWGAIITAVGAAAGAVVGAWGFATFAATHVMAPHLA